MKIPGTTTLFFFPLAISLFVISGCTSTRVLSTYESEKTPRILTRDVDFARQIDALLPDTLFPPSTIALIVGDLNDRSVLYERNADLLLTPASNQKLFTSGAALSILGPSHRFVTTAGIDISRRTIFLKGGGDPQLTGTDLDLLADTVALYIGTTGAWSVAGDASLFDSVYWGPGWMWDDALDPDGMGVTALTVNANTIDVNVVAGDNLGSRARITESPPVPFIRVRNETVVVDSVVNPLRVTRPLLHPSNDIVVQGEIRRGGHRSESIAVWEPDRFAAQLFAEALRDRGVHISDIRLDTMPRTAVPAGSVVRTLDTVLTSMNKESDNLSAECLLKTLGAVETGSPGNWINGPSAVRRYLAGEGIDTTKISLVDGSGLSRYNLTTVRTVFLTLAALYHHPQIWSYLVNSLPIAGRDGTLERRMVGTAAEDVVYAKTGTVSGVSSLSGVIEAKGKNSLAFSMMMENFQASAKSYRAVQDSIVAYIVKTYGIR